MLGILVLSVTFLFAFILFFGLTFIDSFFDHKTLLLHGEIPITVSGTPHSFWFQIIWDFGIRFFLLFVCMYFWWAAISIIFGGYFNNNKDPKPLNLKAKLVHLK